MLRESNSLLRADILKYPRDQGGNLSPFLLNFALEYTIKMAQLNHEGLKLNEYISFWSMLMTYIYRGSPRSYKKTDESSTERQ
jgi:hypothetical protein